jgi:mRNA interferase MazF
MKRGEFYRVRRPGGQDPKKSRVFLVVGRQVLIDSQFSTVICAPVYSKYDSLSTQIPVGTEVGLKHESSVNCDELVSLPKTVLTDFVGALTSVQIQDLDRALCIALDIRQAS